MAESPERTNPAPPQQAPGSMDAQIDREVAEALGGQSVEDLMAAEARQAADAAARESEPAEDGTAAGDGDESVGYQLARGRITAVRGDDVFVQVTGFEGKNEGVVPLTQFERPPRVGSIMDFVVDRYDDAEGLLHLSREGAVTHSTWDTLKPGVVVEARVTGVNKGGLELELAGRVRAFMPASQVDLGHVDDLEAFVGQKLAASVQDIDRKGKHVVLSRRKHLEHQRKAREQQTLATLQEGDVREGRVSNIVDFGAFVDIGGVDGLVHVSDLSYQHVKHVKDLLAVGQPVKVKVLKVDKDSKRISLGMKQVEPDPWDGLADRLKPGESLSVRVVRTANFGAFAEVEAGVEGLIPISELSWRRLKHADEVVKPGDVVQVVVLQVDPEQRRLSMSVKQSAGDPWSDAETKYAAHSLAEGAVTRLTDYGAFVELEPGVEGLVHISELADRHVGSVDQVLTVGQTETFRVLQFDAENRRIRLSLKAVNQQAEAPPPPQAEKRERKKKRPGVLKGGLD